MAQFAQFNLPRASVGDIVVSHPGTESTASAFTAHIPKTSAPSGDGVLNIAPDGSMAHIGVILQPYADANDVTFSLRLWAWRQGNLFGTLYFVPQLIAEVLCTAGNISAGFVASRFLADTLTLTAGDSTVNLDSPANDCAGGIMAHAWGAHYLEIELAINGGSAAAMNCVVRPHSS